MSLPENATTSAFVAAPPRLPDIAPHVEVGPSETTIIKPIADVVAPAGSRAVVYLRVSSKGQVNTDYDPEGISIPAQRQSCQRKAEQLGLSIVAEYVEAGMSGTEMTKRVAFQQMLERIRRDKDVDYVIVYKLSRFARNRTDDAIVMADLQKRGVTLISATESIDATPVGQLMHGILAAFNEYRSREDGADIAYKMGQKARKGGTLGRTPLGYFNTLERVDGREFRGVAVDEERAPFVKLAFELYASTELTMEEIAEQLEDRGLTTRPTPKRRAQRVSASMLSRMYRNRYYLGEVTYKGEIFEGRHPAMVNRDLFMKVQRRLESTGKAGERKRVHHSYLKGSLWCGECFAERGLSDSRMVIQRALGRNGSDYFYFFCRARQEGICTSRHLPIDAVEDAVIDHYRTVQLRPEFIGYVEGQVDDALDDQVKSQREWKNQLEVRRNELDAKAANLVELVADGGMAVELAKQRLRQIEMDRADIDTQLATVVQDLSAGVEYLKGWLELLRDPHTLYARASNEMRRRLNQAIFVRIFIADEGRVASELSEPARLLLEAQSRWQSMHSGDGIAAGDTTTIAGPQEQTTTDEVDGWSKDYLVDLRGIEPLTSSLRTKRATNCATGP